MGRPTATAFSVDSLNPVKAFQGFAAAGKLAAGSIPAIGLFFAFWSSGWLRMAPNYGEESKDSPERMRAHRRCPSSSSGCGIFCTRITS